MSLAAKLNKLSSELSETKIVAEKEEKAKALVPVKDKIKDLEGQKSSLELIYNSLADQSDKKGVGLNMPEYAQKIKKDVSSQEAKLDQLVAENAEVLETAGVKNRQDLLDHPDFSEEEEVVTYKESLSQTEDLVGSDEALRARLSGLGIELGEGESSYQAIAQAVSEKMKLIDKELMQEKIKVPEFRQEVVSMLADNLIKDLHKRISPLQYKEEAGSSQLIVESRGDRVQIDYDGKGKAKVDSRNQSWLNGWADVLPDLDSLEKDYGQEVASEALHLAWRRNLEDNVNSYEAKKNGDSRLIKQSLETNLANKTAARESLNKLQTIKVEVESLLKSKQEELQIPRKFSFDYSCLDLTYIHSIDKLLGDITPNDNFPPKYDYQAIRDQAEEKIKAATIFIDKLRAVTTKEELDGFTNTNARTGPLAELFSSTKGSGSLDFKLPESQLSRDQTWHAIDNFKRSGKSSQQIIEELNKKINQTELAVDKIAGKIEEVIAIKEKEQEYAKLARELNLGSRVRDFEEMENKRRTNKTEAINMIDGLNRAERLVKDICERRKIDDKMYFSAAQQSSVIRIFLPALQEIATNLHNKINEMGDNIITHKNSQQRLEGDMRSLGEKPMFFSGSWEKKQQALQAQIDEVKINLANTEQEKLRQNKLLDEVYSEMNSLEIKKNLYDARESVFEEISSGPASEVFKVAKDKLVSKFVDVPGAPAPLKKVVEEREKLIESIFS